MAVLALLLNNLPLQKYSDNLKFSKRKILVAARQFLDISRRQSQENELHVERRLVADSKAYKYPFKKFCYIASYLTF